MGKYKIDIFDYSVPLKQELPCLSYDIALYCSCLQHILPIPAPEYMGDYSERINAYSKQIKRAKPKEFPSGFRIYIVDNRLRVLFTCIDPDGKTATIFSKYGARGKGAEDCCYGDGSKVGHVSLLHGYDKDEMREFYDIFGFLPIEELAFSEMLIFDGSELEDRRPLTHFQSCVLMEMFRSKNLVDWKKFFPGVKDMCSYTF